MKAAKRSRMFMAYTGEGRAFPVFATTIGKALRLAEVEKTKGEELLAIVDASCVPAPAKDAPPFFAILLRNRALDGI
jgi:hypothetical protein